MTTGYVYGYDVSVGDLRPFSSEAAWRSQLTPEAAQRYIRDHLGGSLDAEFLIAHAAYVESMRSGRATGYWTLVRLLFPTINFLGTLYAGRDSSASAVQFMVEYMGNRRRDIRYEELSGLLYAMYRHGLMHSHMPKVFERDDGMLVGVTFDPRDHLRFDRSCVVVCPEELYNHLRAAIGVYATDFDDPPKTKELTRRFCDGFLTMGRVFEASDVGPSLAPDVERGLQQTKAM